jgi:hypothetical protein
MRGVFAFQGLPFRGNPVLGTASAVTAVDGIYIPTFRRRRR